MKRSKFKGNRSLLWEIVDQRFQDIYYDLRQCCRDSDEEERIHEEDLKDFLYDNMMEHFGSYEEYQANEDKITETIRARCQPDSEGWIAL